MTLKWLYYFLEICKDMNMSKTASRLFISQQGLSKAINSLENELQCTLFIRSHSGVTLTDAGTYLLQQGHQILDLIDTTQNHLKQYSESQDIQISVPNGASAIFTNRLPNQFAGRPISYTEVDEDEWISGLEKGSYDAAIVSDLVNSGKWYVRPFYREYLALIVSAQQPITKSNPNLFSLHGNAPMRTGYRCLLFGGTCTFVAAFSEYKGTVSPRSRDVFRILFCR